jgi:adenylate cyclase
MMAFWNAPLDVDRHPFRACSAALLMRSTLAELNRTDAFHLRRHARSLSEIQIGIGISTGQALVGNLGLESRFDYSCVGDTVNVASRVEAACKTVGYDIVVVEATRAAASDLAFLEAGSIPLKGKSKRERIHILVGDTGLAASKDFAELIRAHGDAIMAVREGRSVDAAIARCLSLVTFNDRYLATFYATMKGRRSDFVPDSDILLATADLGLPA